VAPLPSLASVLASPQVVAAAAALAAVSVGAALVADAPAPAALLLAAYAAASFLAVAVAVAAWHGARCRRVARRAAPPAPTPAASTAAPALERVVRARYVVNAAGLGSDKISAMVGDTSFTVKPRAGDYFLLHKDQGHLVRRVLFPTPTKLGKGIIIQPTLWGTNCEPG
jgi:hypothetical protein